MPTNPSLTITIDRASLSLADLVMTASAGYTGLGIVNYTEPAMQSRILYAPSSAYIPGDVALAATWQQTSLNFDVVAPRVSTETQARAAIAELLTAIYRLQFPLTVSVSDADGETWTCDAGSVAPLGSRTYVDLRYHGPVWGVSIPCHPVRAVA